MQTGDMQQFPEPVTPGPEGWVMSPNPKQWFKFDLSLFDEWIRKLSPEAGILLCVLVRKMAAWDKTEDTISVSQFMAASGMKKRRVQRAIKDLLESGAPVEKIGRGKDGATYSLDLPGGVTSDATSPAAQESGGVASDATSPMTPTTDTPKSINRTETDGGVGTAVPDPGSPENLDNPASQPIPSQEEGLVGEDELPNIIHTSQQPSVSVSVVSVVNNNRLGLEAQPYRKQNHSVVSKRTDKRYELGINDAEYVADVLQIMLKDARGIMHDCPGANGYQMLAVVLENEKSKERVMNANNRPAYVRAIVKANVARILAQNPFPGGSKANKPAAATSKPLPPHGAGRAQGEGQAGDGAGNQQQNQSPPGLSYGQGIRRDGAWRAGGAQVHPDGLREAPQIGGDELRSAAGVLPPQ